MNAASELPREEEIQSKIRKIRAFGRAARTICTALFWFGAVISVVMLALPVMHILSPNSPTFLDPVSGGVDQYLVLFALRTSLQLKVWAFLSLYPGFVVSLAALLQLRRLFANLAKGEIHSSTNVRCVRNVGLLWLLLAVLDVLLPTLFVAANGFMNAPLSLDLDTVFPSIEYVLPSFITAGFVLLVSWIMGVGLYEKQHADALRNEADLVI